MLALLILAQHVIGKEISKEPHIIKQTHCPDVGYFFKREPTPNSIEPACHLCFCEDSGNALCWPRESRRCNEKSYYHAGKRKRDIRVRRSPGFSDIFFRDAARDVFNKRLPEECKPFESSFSEGCPPADWCIGCTVCDCDANGRWDCHTLSFCPDNKGKKQMKKRRGLPHNKVKKRQLSTKKTTPVTTKIPTRKPSKKINKKEIKGKHFKKHNNTKQINAKKHKQDKMKSKRTKNPKASIHKRNVTKSKINFNKKGKKPVTLKNTKRKDRNITKNDSDSTAILAKNIMKKVMASVEKFVNENRRHFYNSTTTKTVQKKSMPKHYKKGHKKSDYSEKKVKSKIVNNNNANQEIRVSHKNKEKIIISSRKKREITSDAEFGKFNESLILTTPITKFDSNYYRYSISPFEANKRKTILNQTNTSNLRINISKDIHYETLTKNYSKLIEQKVSPKTNQSIRTSPIYNTTVHKENVTCENFCELKQIFRKLFFGTKRNITRKSIKPNILSQLRKILFKNTNKDSRNNVRITPFKKRNIIKILCKNINSCESNFTSKELQYKLEKLRTESNNILKSVSIIKGLLKLLNVSKDDAIVNYTDKNKQFTDNDITKLNKILKDEFDAKYNLINLTATQRIQISYIKENTLSFIRSVENFAYHLNDIIKILTKSQRNDKYDLSNRYYKYLKDKQRNNITKHDMMNSKLQSLRNLLIKYNLIQNKFMKQMFDVLSTSKSYEPKYTKLKVSENPTGIYNEVEIYTNNILTNLRKLKNLAEKLNSKSRKKRAIVEDDDAIEYLLMLMEYLLKQNRPIDVSPVNDGIDLLIEAIKSAPNIKPIKKKVLNNDIDTLNLRKNNEINSENNFTLNLVDKGFKTFESIDEEEDSNKLTKSNTFNEFNQETMTMKYKDLTTELNIESVTEKMYTINDIVNDRMEKLAKEEIRRFEVFVDDTDEDDIAFENATHLIEPAIEGYTETHHIVPLRTSSPTKIDAKIDHEWKDEENKTKLDWIDENYHREEELKKDIKVIETTTETVTEAATRTVKVKKDKYADPISSMSHENLDDERKNKIDLSERVFNKEMRLLNTLDYGNDKTLDSGSKEDRYYAESIPS